MSGHNPFLQSTGEMAALLAKVDALKASRTALKKKIASKDAEIARLRESLHRAQSGASSG